MPRRGASSSSGGSRWMTVALCLVVLLDIVLVTMALRPPDDAGVVEVRAPRTTATAAADAPAEPTASPTTSQAPSPAATEPPEAVPLTRLLDAVSTTHAWRLTTGLCPGGGGVVERTEDGGRTWTPSEADLTSYVRLKGDSPTAAFVVGTRGQACEPAFARTRDAETWAGSPASLDVAWYVDPADAAAVHSSAGTVPGPCDGPVVDLAPVTSTSGAVLCGDGRVFGTDTAGEGWQLLAVVAGGVALTDHPDGFAVAALGEPTCQGLAVALVPQRGPAQVLGCSGVAGAPGGVAISAVDDALWLWAGTQVRVSTDAAASWR